MPYRKNILKIFFVVVMLALVIAQPVSAQDRCHAYVNKVAGSCVYDGSSSTWQVKITLYGYKISFKSDPTNLTFANPNSWNVDYTISLTAGSYTYDKWEWKGYWQYKGTGTLNLETCKPPDASASVSLGACHPSQQGSVSDVNIVIDHATLLINGSSYSTSTSISLAPGSYTWSWVAQEGYWGSGGDTLVVGTCSLPDADASVTLGACHPGEDGSESDVSIVVDHAIVTINGQNYSADADITLPPGSYTWSWVAQSGYAGSGGDTLVVGTCELPEANASVSLETCYPGDPGTESVSDVDISVSHATFQINGSTYTTSESILLGPGSYPWSWTPETGYTGGDSGTLVVDDCSPKYQADFQFDVGSCAWGGEVFERDVELIIDGASVSITGSGGSFGPYTSSQTIKLPCGDYTYVWSAADPAYEGGGSGELSLPECDQSKSDAAANIGACTYGDGESLTLVDIIVENAIFTIDGKSYSENTLLKLLPGDYAYSWGPASGEFSGSGEGVLTIGACAPKEEKEEEDPSVDVAAGGSGPSLLVSVTPLMALIGSLGIAWVISEQTRVRKTK